MDQAESDPAGAFAVNRDGVASLADACRDVVCPLLHLSTDYVFDGTASRPYREEDPTAPLGDLRSQQMGGGGGAACAPPEHLIVRTAWLYGHHGSNFVKTMLRLARERQVLQVVQDQHGCPTWTRDLARALTVMCQRLAHAQDACLWGTYHFCGAGQTTWYDFARAIFAEVSSSETLQHRTGRADPNDGLPHSGPATSLFCPRLFEDPGGVWYYSSPMARQFARLHAGVATVNAYCPRNILVTGGAGFIGCHLVRHFLRTDPQVRVVTLDLLTYAGSLDNLADLPGADRHCFVQGDICDQALVTRLLP